MSQPPRTVLHVISGLSAGGAEGMLRNLLRYRRNGCLRHEVVSLTCVGDLGREIEATGVSVHALGARRGSAPSPMDIWRLRNVARAVRPVIVQGWMYHGNLAAQGMAAALAFRPLLFWAIRCSLPGFDRHALLTRATIRLGARLSRFPRHIIYNSERGLSDHLAAGYNAANAVVIPNGFDMQVFRPDCAARAAIRRELGIPACAPVVGMVANFTPMKDHKTFLDAAWQLQVERPDAHFILTGAGVDGGNAALSHLVNGRPWPAHVHLIGQRRDIPAVLAACDIAALSSLEEAFPNVVGEAMATGVPCVATDVGDVRQIISDTGFVVERRDVDGLLAAWRAIFAMMPADRQALGAAARERIASEYSIEKISAAYERLYQDSLGGDGETTKR